MKNNSNLYDKITSKFSFNQKNSKDSSRNNLNKNNDSQKKIENSPTKNINSNEIKKESSSSSVSSNHIEPSLKTYNELKNCVKNRRSVRQFTPYKPPYKILFEILETSFYSPKAGNVSNTEYIIIEDVSKKATISNLCYQQSWISQAPYIIIVISSKDDIQKLYPDMSSRFSTQNTAVQIQNLLLLIHSAGFSSCWVQSFQEEVLKDYLGIPPNLEIHAVLPVGFAKEIPSKPIMPDINMKLSYEEFGNRDK